VQAAAVLALALVALSACATVGQRTQQSFATPREAVTALLDTIERDDKSALIQILGSDYRDQVVTADWNATREERERISQAASDTYALSDISETEVELIVGIDRWPFPIRIVTDGAGWYFDTERGLVEIVNRRIGRNELRAIALSHAYVDAQIEYATRDRNGDGYLEYARRLSSTPGTRDGLYWPASDDEPPSPFGPLVTRAERYLDTLEPGDPIRGYYFRVLTRQGDNPPGGRHDYIIDGRMVAGFALVAFPAEYDNTGAMTFVVSQRGVVYQRDLGDRGAKVEEYDPDDSWSVVTGVETD
jgi:hypothetical protein